MERKIARTTGGMAVLFVAAMAVLVGCSGQSGSTENPEQAAPVRGAPITILSGEGKGEAEAAPGEEGADDAGEIAEGGPAESREDTEERTSVAGNEPAAEPEPEAEAEFLTVSFERLASFDYDVPEYEGPDEEENNEEKAAPVAEIPSEIKELNERRVALKGFMLPLRVESGLVTEMLLMRDQSMCCYGTVPRINEWVSVTMSEKGVKAVMDQPVTLFGKLHVGEVRENGYLVGIYTMDAEKMLGPLDY